MPGSLKLNWYGVERLKEINDKVKKGMDDSRMLVEGDAKRMCPVDTGHLRAFLSSKIEVSTDTEIVADIGYKTSWVNWVPYAPFQELGTSKMAAQPFLFPALEANKSRIKDLLKG